MQTDSEVAIIGAGPYGLSIAAHLRKKGISFRIFGTSMRMWRTQVLHDSHLKSEGFASSLYDPHGEFSLGAFCKETGRPYADIGLPVPCATFIDYGNAFQRRYVPDLDTRDIVELARSNTGFTLRAEDGELLTARRVIVAAGIGHFQYLPRMVSDMPDKLVSHSSAYPGVETFAGRDVVVLGAGASALDLVLELRKVAGRVRLMTRRQSIDFHDAPRPRSLLDKIRAPMSGLGPGWKSRLCTDAPLLFHAMPESFRIGVVRRHLGPAPCWFTREAFDRGATFLLGRQLRAAEAHEGRIRLGLTALDGTTEELVADHLVAATGYRVDLGRLAFLPDDIRVAIRLCDTSPARDQTFQSSVPGLYFVGLAAANSFGPLSRFAFGARFTAARLTTHLARMAVRRSSLPQVAAA